MNKYLMIMAMVAAGAAAGAGCAAPEGPESKEGTVLVDGARIDEEGSLGEAQSAVVVSTGTQMARVGRQVFFDTNLSNPPGQSCATCHALSRAFTDPATAKPTSQGVIAGSFGVRNAPTAAYSAFSPALNFVAGVGWSGGQFWDGRVDTLAQQAQAPFLNPIEMHTDAATVVAKVQASAYAPLFIAAFGANAFADVNTAFTNIGKCVQSWEQQRVFFPFTSRFDNYYAGKGTLTAAEMRGLALFSDPARANCASCHPIGPDADGSVSNLFTDFGYDNLGIPQNPNNPFYTEPSINPAGSAYIDNGLGVTVNDPAYNGFFKSPTVRNLSKTGPYMHNGYFSTLKQVVHFYNTRDVPGAGWPAPEVPDTMNTDNLGNLGLTDAEENDIVSFLGTLDDASATIKSCTNGSSYSLNQAEWPNHEPGLCGPAKEILPEEGALQCKQAGIKYYSYTCQNFPDGTHAWSGYLTCCATTGTSG